MASALSSGPEKVHTFQLAQILVKFRYIVVFALYLSPLDALNIIQSDQAFWCSSQVWDGAQCKKVRTLSGHQTRTGVLAWSSRILSSGSRDRNILQHDLRVPNDYISKLSGHKSEVKAILPFAHTITPTNEYFQRN